MDAARARDAGAQVRRGGLEWPELPGRLRSLRGQLRQPVRDRPSVQGQAHPRYHQTFPDLHIDIEELIAADDTVVLRAAFRGTDTAELLGTSRTRLILQRGPDGFFGPELVPPAGAPVADVLAGFLGRKF
jgi:hypothetical protein